MQPADNAAAPGAGDHGDAGAIVSRSEQRARLVRQVFRETATENPASIIRRLAYPDNSSAQKMDLAHRLSHCGRDGDRKSLIAAVQLLHDPDPAVRGAGLDALERLIPMRSARDFDGRKEVIAALGHMCTDYSQCSRQKALGLLVAVAEKSDPDVLAAVMTEVFKEPDELPLYARLAAVSAVPAVVKGGDQWAIRPLISELEDEDPTVRHTTISSLRKIAQRGHAEVVAALCKHLRDENFDVRLLTIETLVDLGSMGDRQIIDQLCDVLDECEIDAADRLPLAKALVSLSEPGCERAVASLLPMINAPDVGVRLFASESIGIKAPHGHFPSYTALMSKLNREKTEQFLITHDNRNKATPQKKDPKRPSLAKSFSLSGVDLKATLSTAGEAKSPPAVAADESSGLQTQPTGEVYGTINADLSSDASTASTASTAGEDAEGDQTGSRAQDETRVSVDAIREGHARANKDMETPEEEKEGEEQGYSLSMLPLTPPYSPQQGAGRGTASHSGLWQTPEDGKGWAPENGLELDKLKVYVPPLKHPRLSPLTPAKPGSRTARSMMSSNFGPSFVARSGSKSARGSPKELLPLSTPSPQSLSISIARSRAWLTLPPSRLGFGDRQTRLHCSTPGSSPGPKRTPYAKGVVLDISGRSDGDVGASVLRTASGISAGGTHIGRTGSTGTAASVRLHSVLNVSRTGSGAGSKPGQSREREKKITERKRSSFGGAKHPSGVNMEPLAKVRQAVIKSLTTVGIPGDIELLEVITERLHDTDLQVQRQAVLALTVLIVPVVDGPIEQHDEDVEIGDNIGQRISEVMAIFRSLLLLLIEHRSNKCRQAALEGLKVIAKPGDFNCLNKLVTNIHQLPHLDAVQLLKRIATPSSSAVVIDCLFYCIQSHDEKMCEDEKSSQAQLKFYVDYLKETSGHGNRDVILKLVKMTKAANLSRTAKQACMMAVHGLVAKQDREIVMSTLVGSGAVRDLEIALQGPRLGGLTKHRHTPVPDSPTAAGDAAVPRSPMK